MLDLPQDIVAAAVHAGCANGNVNLVLNAGVVESISAEMLVPQQQSYSLFAVCHDELAYPLMLNAFLPAIFIQQMLALHAESGLQAAFWVVDSGMYDFRMS